MQHDMCTSMHILMHKMIFGINLNKTSQRKNIHFFTASIAIYVSLLFVVILFSSAARKVRLSTGQLDFSLL